MASGALPSIEGWMGRPLWGRRAADEGRRLAEGVFFSNQKNTPSRFPRKIVRGDGVVTSSISLAAAQRAPAHSFRCSSFSHRKTLRWEPCISPLTTPLKRPKERPAGLSFGNLSEGCGGFSVRRTLGRGSEAGCAGSFRTIGRVEDEGGEGMVVLAGDWEVEGPAGGRGDEGRGFGPPGSSCPTGGCGGQAAGGRKKAPALAGAFLAQALAWARAAAAAGVSRGVSAVSGAFSWGAASRRSRATASISLMRFSWLTRVAPGS